MYGFAPISLAALHKLDPDRPRPYRVPAPKLVLPTAFVSANLIIYWGSFPTTWKLVIAMAVGLVLFAIGAAVKKTGANRLARYSAWLAPWLLGHLAIGAIGRYTGIADALRYDHTTGKMIGEGLLPEWVDNAVVIVFSILIYQLALRLALSKQDAAAQIARDAYQLEFEAK
jgi:amino acid transporter